LRNNNNTLPQARNIGDVVCGGIPTNIIPKTKNIMKTYKVANRTPVHDSFKLILDIIRYVTHITQVTLQDCRTKDVELQNKTKGRVQFMLKDFDQDIYKNMLYKKDRERKLNAEYINIWEAFSNVGIDFLRFLDDTMSSITNPQEYEKAYNEILKQLDNFVNYIEYNNAVMTKISKLHKIRTERFVVEKDSLKLIMQQ
jgi:hypothetical protein